MALTTEQAIDIVAPALRGLLATDGTLPLVRRSDTTDPTAVPASLNGADTPETIVAALRDALGATRPEAVAISGLGTFRACSPETGSGHVAGRVAVVTGGAQGFGLGIAEALAAQGAFVVLADINADGAESAAAGLCAEFGEERAIGVAMNVTDGDSIRAALHQVVIRYGGIDLFIANAGVLRAESVKTQPVKDFEFVTAVNYKGYFLSVQAAAPIMATQHLANPESWSDIVQINSKSGLVGSNRNGAYAGSKFGGIGLTQSFALELVSDGIKVNSICPGNFFDGPLWSDPDNGLFVQYLRSGKVPGATSIEEVRKFYEAKVPMKRGCTPEDVMTAVYYLVGQKYETGQALPVTGGQVMLS